MNEKLEQSRELRASKYPGVYENAFLNKNGPLFGPPLLTGAEYLELGYKAGFDACYEEMKPLIEALEEIIRVSGTSCLHYHIAKIALKDIDETDELA